MRRILFSFLSLTLLATACGDDSAGSAADWCDGAQRVETISDSLDDPTDYRAFRDAVDEVKGSAPAEIRDAVNTTADFLDDMADALENNDDNIILAFDEIQQDADMAEIEAAGDAITEYNARECGIGEVDATDDDTDSSSDDDSEEPDFSGGIVAGLAEQLGVTEEQARCLVEKLGVGDTDNIDPNEVVGVFGECDINPLDLAG